LRERASACSLCGALGGILLSIPRTYSTTLVLASIPIMRTHSQSSPAEAAVALVHEFFARVWGPDHDLAAIDVLMTSDYRITSGGKLIAGREAFKGWVRGFQQVLLEARTLPLESFANAAGDRVVSRWICSGRNNGIFNLPPDGRAVEFTGIAIWQVATQRLAECWAERAALEAYQALSGSGRPTAP
jgi:hypothetical protein